MSAAGDAGGLFDRRFAVGLLAIVAFCVVVALLWGANIPSRGGNTISGSYAQVDNYALATFVYVPTLALCVTGALRPLTSAMWATRSNRMRNLLLSVVRLAARSVAFSATLTLCGLLSVCLLSPVGHPALDYLAFGLLATALQALFFMVVCLIILVVRLRTGSGAYAVLAALGYAALDYLLCMTTAFSNPALWTGWLLVTVSLEDGLAAEALGALRLVSACVLLGMLAACLMRKKDFLPEEGEPREL